MRENTMKSTVGIDLGDKSHRICVLGENGEILSKKTIPNTAQSIRKYFSKFKRVRIAMEVGTHSPWISHLLKEMGHEVYVGNTRKLKAIWGSDLKDDDRDALTLAEIAQIKPSKLYPIQHRGLDGHADLAILKARDALVRSRTQLVNFVRGSVKSMGHRISKCTPECFPKRACEELPTLLRVSLEPILDQIGNLTKQIRIYDKKIKQLANYKYPETYYLNQITGVGELTSLAYVLIIEDPNHFDKSRDVGPYLGLTPKRDQSGTIDKQLGITKAGDVYLRRLLVGCANYILGHFGPDCDLRRFGLKLSARGGKNARKRARVAVARRLAVLLHRLWMDKSVYDPFYQSPKRKAA